MKNNIRNICDRQLICQIIFSSETIVTIQGTTSKILLKDSSAVTMLGDIQLNMPHTHLRAQESKSEEMQLEMDLGFKTIWYLKANHRWRVLITLTKNILQKSCTKYTR